MVLLLTMVLLLAPLGHLSAEEQQFEFMQEFEGLHITGKPFDFDMNTYRLTVTGKVDNPLSLTFEEVKALPAVRKKIVLNCPGFFTDIGTWTGVPIKVLLELAKIRKDAKVVIFSVPDDSYRTRFPVEEAIKEDMLIAYEFNGKQFHRVHGFPLRVVAGGHEGSDWVKWLQKIVVE